MQGYLVAESWTWCEKVHIRMAFSEGIEDVGRFQVRKVVELIRVLARLVWERRAGPIDVVYYPPAGSSVSAFFRDLVILPVLLLLGKRVVLHYHSGGSHGLIERMPRPVRALARWLYAKVNLGIVLAPSLAADIVGVKEEKIIVVPNGVEEPPGVSFGGAGNSTRALYVGTLMPEKGIIDLLGGLREARSSGVPIALDLVGGFVSERFRSECGATIERFGLRGCVRLHGVLVAGDKWKLYRGAGMFVFPTYYPQENQPLVLIEAMMWGLPIIATSWRAIPEMVTDANEAFLVQPHDVRAMGDRLARLGSEADLRSRMGVAARRRYEEEYSVRKHLDRMAAALRDVANVVEVSIR
jgi:glycosyltransferase involved in cell wall biosynthesis